MLGGGIAGWCWYALLRVEHKLLVDSEAARLDGLDERLLSTRCRVAAPQLIPPVHY